MPVNNHLYVGTYDGIRCIDLSTDDFKTEENPVQTHHPLPL